MWNSIRSLAAVVLWLSFTLPHPQPPPFFHSTSHPAVRASLTKLSEAQDYKVGAFCRLSWFCCCVLLSLKLQIVVSLMWCSAVSVFNLSHVFFFLLLGIICLWCVYYSCHFQIYLWFILVFLTRLETDVRATNANDQKSLWEVAVLSHCS